MAEARGRGLGRRLMTEAIDAARALGMERIELEVFASNARAIALYKSRVRSSAAPAGSTTGTTTTC